MTTLRALSLSVALGFLLPGAMTFAPVDAHAAQMRASTLSPDEAKTQLAALQAAGIRTHGELAAASPRVLVRIMGSRRGRALQHAAKAHTGARGLLDPSTPLDVVSIIEPQFIVSPRYKRTADAKQRLERAQRELSGLPVATYADLLQVDRRELTAAVGRSRARAMVAAAQSLQRNARGRAAIIDPQFLKARIDAAFVADPTMVPGVESPLSKVGANPTPHP